ncbi:cytochrome P450, partial [Oryctes borbonicus]
MTDAIKCTRSISKPAEASVHSLAAIMMIYFESGQTYPKSEFIRRRNVPTPKPRFFFGHSQNPLARTSTSFQHIKTIYDQMRAHKYDYCGIYIFIRAFFMPLSPDHIKDIMLKDFAHFVDRGMYSNERDDPLSVHLLSLQGQKWKSLRAKLTPTFSSSKLKMMFGTLLDCGNQMLKSMEQLSKNPLDIKEICACYTTDVIGSCAFGVDCNSFAETESEFRKYGRKALDLSIETLLRLSIMILGNAAKKLRIKLIDSQVSKFFLNVIKTALQHRKENQIVRNDFLQLLIELKEKNQLNTEEIAAQAYLFFLAGFETSSTTMAFCMLELAGNESIQDKVREEIFQVFDKYNGKLLYESLTDMKYLGQVIDETLRLYPSIPFISRVCTKDYKIHNSEVVIEKGTRVFLPVYALHRDPEYYPSPDNFNPDRFNDENKSKRHPFVYLPFGEGPRVCIGQRFGLMQVKMGLAILLKNYKFTVNRRTKLPVEFECNNFLLRVKGDIWLDA